LFDVLRDVAGRKALVVLKGGRSVEGARAAASHTGVLAGSAGIWDGFLRQVGAVRVNRFDEMADFVVGFLYAPLPKGRGVSIVTTSGGSAVINADYCASVGLAVPSFSEETQGMLSRVIPGVGSSVRNPLDTWYALRHGLLPEALDMVARDEGIHSLIVETRPEQFRAYSFEPTKNVEELVVGLGKACKEIMGAYGKPIMLAVPQSVYPELEALIRGTFIDMDLPVFRSVHDAVETLSKLYQYRLGRDRE
jgi:acyl-CoA synthetase (NDP forming)